MAGTHKQFHDYVRKENSPSATAAFTTTPPTPSRKTTNSTEKDLKETINSFVYPIRPRPKPEPVKKLANRPVVEKFDIKFPVTMEMVPSCWATVYYVREDDEVVADSIKFDVEDKLKNQVK